MAEKNEPLYIGSRVEMFIDDALAGQTFNTALKLHPPVPQEVVLPMDAPWEGSFGTGIYTSLFHDGEKYRLYYRALAGVWDEASGQQSYRGFTCVAYSSDGLTWEKPRLGLVEFAGSKDNNIVLEGHMTHNFAPMLDTKPGCPANERFKAVAGSLETGLLAYTSADGLRWEPLQEAPIITDGAFDSLNLCFYDERIGKYRCYSRYSAAPMADAPENRIVEGDWEAGAPAKPYHGIRAIQSCTSEDFIHWSQQQPNLYPMGAPQDEFYTNATTRCPGAEHYYLSFPMRMVDDRKKVAEHPHTGVSDAVFLSSRDGVHFDRSFPESWIRPGLDRRDWTERNFTTAGGIVETAPEEFSLYVSEHYNWEDAHIRRYTVRRHGFGSMNAPYSGGMFVTKPFIFEGSHLHLNYATGAPGSIRVGIVADETGWPASGYSTEECDIIYGNELDTVVSWKGNADLTKFAGKKVALKFEMKDADLYSFHFSD